MFTWLEKRRLRKRHAVLLREARDLQRKGDIQAFAAKTAEAEEVARRLDALTGSPNTRS